MSELDRTRIVTAGQVHFYPAGSTVFKEGAACAGLFVLFKGRVNMCKLGLQGQETIVSVIRPTIMFNEVAVLDGGPNPLTAVAVEDCATWRLSHESFIYLAENYPEVGTGLLRILASRFRAIISQYEDLLSRPVLARAAKIILDLSNQGRKTIDRGNHSNQELAARAATGPEVFSRSLKRLREAGVIECSRTEIIVHSPRKLAEMALIEPCLELYSEN
jgi:CRP/FNR family transcriptional regulator